MIDERIKEEFERWAMFCESSQEKELLSNGLLTRAGFHAGFRAAERLAKIEVLEEVLALINTPCTERFASDYEEGIRDKRNNDVETIESMLSGLKEEL